MPGAFEQVPWPAGDERGMGNPQGASTAPCGLRSQSGIHLAEDRVWLSSTPILALGERGGSGSPVRPVAYGAPRK
jgi:hypothetical protein